MVFPRMSSAMLLASVILFVHWTTSAAESHDPSPAHHSALRRLKRELDATTKEQIQSGFRVGIDFMTTVAEATSRIDPNKLASVFKGLANFASLAPGIGNLVGSIINVVLAIIPQENIIEELRNGFSEVNRRLDSLAIQISNLATDVEWFNFASVYSQDETRILNAWEKLTELQTNLKLVTTEKEKLRLAEIFTNFYEDSGTEGSVTNIYYYLTVSGTSLSRNINTLLTDKYKCSIRHLGQYNVYLSSLLWKGMVVNQLYWKLIGFDSARKQAEHNRMFKAVFTAQREALQSCLDNYQQYMVQDVKEDATSFSKDQKQHIADKVQNTLDEKYYWYKWVVMVYEKNNEANYKLVQMTPIPVGDLVVAVGHTQKETLTQEQRVISAAKTCFQNIQCSQLQQKEAGCTFEVGTNPMYIDDQVLEYRGHENRMFTEFAKIMHYFYYYTPIISPQPLYSNIQCQLGGFWYYIHVYSSVQLPTCSSPNTCQNGGVCKQLMDSNEYLCECPDGYYGDSCEKSTSIVHNIEIGSLVPDISTLNDKLEQMEKKLDQLLTAQSPQ